MTQRLNSDSSKFTLFRCQGVFYPTGSKRGINMLSMSEVSFNNTVDYMTADAYDDAVTYEAQNVASKVICEMSITLDEASPLALAAHHFTSDVHAANSQTATTTGTTTIPEADVYFDPTSKNPGIYQLIDALGNPVQNVSTVVITYGLTAAPAAITLVEGVNYVVDYNSGVFSLINPPATLVTPSDLVATFHQAALLTTAGLLDVGGLSGTGITGRLSLLSVNAGLLWRCDVNSVRLGPDGNADLQNTDKFSQFKLKGKVFACSNDPTSGLVIPKKYRFYRLQQLDNPPS